MFYFYENLRSASLPKYNSSPVSARTHYVQSIKTGNVQRTLYTLV
jgi:hypothetical protein